MLRQGLEAIGSGRADERAAAAGRAEPEARRLATDGATGSEEPARRMRTDAGSAGVAGGGVSGAETAAALAPARPAPPAHPPTEVWPMWLEPGLSALERLERIGRPLLEGFPGALRDWALAGRLEQMAPVGDWRTW